MEVASRLPTWLLAIVLLAGLGVIIVSTGSREPQAQGHSPVRDPVFRQPVGRQGSLIDASIGHSEAVPVVPKESLATHAEGGAPGSDSPPSDSALLLVRTKRMDYPIRPPFSIEDYEQCRALNPCAVPLSAQEADVIRISLEEAALLLEAHGALLAQRLNACTTRKILLDGDGVEPGSDEALRLYERANATDCLVATTSVRLDDGGVLTRTVLVSSGEDPLLEEAFDQGWAIIEQHNSRVLHLFRGRCERLGGVEGVQAQGPPDEPKSPSD